MPETPDLSFALNLPPEKVIEYLGGKKDQVSFRWQDVLQESHAKAFTVAKAMKMDVLQDIHEMVNKAATDGIAFAQFKKELEPRLRAKGWWGKQEVLDEKTGELLQAQLGSPRRLKTIYDTNMAVAFNVGRYREQMDNAEGQPYWQYLAVMDRRTRPSHAALSGRVFPATDPFWESHYPPNGWGCRCRVAALSGRTIERKKLTAESSDGKLSTEIRKLSNRPGEEVPVTVFHDPVTGRNFAPDPGWSYNPGKAWSIRDTAPLKVVPGQKTWKDFERPDLRDVPDSLKTPDPGMLTAGKTRSVAVEIVKRAVGITEKAPTVIIKTPVEEVAIREELIAHTVDKQSEGRERYANYILPALTDPFEVYNTEYENGIYRTRYIGLFSGKTDVLIVVDQRKDGGLFWNFMQGNDKSMNKMRVGTLWFKKKE